MLYAQLCFDWTNKQTNIQQGSADQTGGFWIHPLVCRLLATNLVQAPFGLIPTGFHMFTIFAILISESSQFSFNNWLISCDSSVDCFNKFILARPNIRLRIVTTDIIDRFTEIKAKLYFSSIINTDNYFDQLFSAEATIYRISNFILHLKIWKKTLAKVMPNNSKSTRFI